MNALIGEEAEPVDQPLTAQGFDVVWDAYGAMVYRLAMVYLGRPADAEDVVQEVFLRLLSKAPAFTDGERDAGAGPPRAGPGDAGGGRGHRGPACAV